jgi:hypothetical protein
MKLAIEIEGELIESWPAFLQLAATAFGGKWYFRGALAHWRLKTSIERAAEDWSIPFSKLPGIERRVIGEFKRTYPVELKATAPSDADYLAWLALMQHHGAPTRLLDWTYSPFVAVYFALETLLSDSEPNHQAAVWAMSAQLLQGVPDLFPRELNSDVKEFGRTRDGILFRRLFLELNPPVRLVGAVSPFALNQRLVIQQGVFLCPGDVSISFEENLSALLTHTDSGWFRKFLFPRSVLREALDSLFRMNMHPASLFPGLDGYARRFRTRLTFFADGDLYEETVW